VATLIRIATAKRLAARLAQRPLPSAAGRDGKPLRWLSRRSRPGRDGATVAPVPPAATPVPPVGAAGADVDGAPAEDVSERAR
jgi:hypothetical protein